MSGEWHACAWYRHDGCDDPHRSNIGTKSVDRYRSGIRGYRRLEVVSIAVEVALARHKGSFMADQRGAVAFETLIVYLFMVTSLLLPLADVAAAGFQFISAWEALRAFGQYVAVPSAT